MHSRIKSDTEMSEQEYDSNQVDECDCFIEACFSFNLAVQRAEIIARHLQSWIKIEKFENGWALYGPVSISPFIIDDEEKIEHQIKQMQLHVGQKYLI